MAKEKDPSFEERIAKIVNESMGAWEKGFMEKMVPTLLQQLVPAAAAVAEENLTKKGQAFAQQLQEEAKARSNGHQNGQTPGQPPTQQPQADNGENRPTSKQITAAFKSDPLGALRLCADTFFETWDRFEKHRNPYIQAITLAQEDPTTAGIYAPALLAAMAKVNPQPPPPPPSQPPVGWSPEIQHYVNKLVADAYGNGMRAAQQGRAAGENPFSTPPPQPPAPSSSPTGATVPLRQEEGPLSAGGARDGERPGGGPRKTLLSLAR